MSRMRPKSIRSSSLPALRVGCAGWSVPAAHAARFPAEGSHLERYAQVFDAVEINSSFYRPHQPQTYRRWAESVPPEFRFAVKLPKTISHGKRLRGATAELDAFLGEAGELGAKLGCVLVQLPPSLAFDARSALAFFDAFRRRHAGPIACEPRHASWFTGAVEAALRARGIARVGADPARVPRAAVPGGGHGVEYLRLHGSPHVYYDAYAPAVLDRIARRLAKPEPATRERWCIFDNTALGHATSDASAVIARLRG